jgi:hypothetical protein
MAKPDILIIDGHAFSWQRLCEMRRKKATINFDLDGRKVSVPIDAEVKAYFNSQFVRPNPTPEQRKRFSTVMNLLRAAYLKRTRRRRSQRHRPEHARRLTLAALRFRSITHSLLGDAQKRATARRRRAVIPVLPGHG